MTRIIELVARMTPEERTEATAILSRYGHEASEAETLSTLGEVGDYFRLRRLRVVQSHVESTRRVGSYGRLKEHEQVSALFICEPMPEGG